MSIINVYERVPSDQSEEMVQLNHGGNDDHYRNNNNNQYIDENDKDQSQYKDYQHDSMYPPLPIYFYPQQFTKFSQLLTATDPLSVALLTATLTIGDVEYYEATLLFILFNFTILFGRHLIMLEIDLTTFLRKKLYTGNILKSIKKVSFTHGYNARIRDLTILTLIGIGGRLLYLSYTSSIGMPNWRFYNMFLVSCIALLLSFFQLYAYVNCLWCVSIPKDTERRLMPHRHKHHPARLQIGTILLERKYSRALTEELATKHNVHIIWLKHKLYKNKPKKQLKSPFESIYNTPKIPYPNPFPNHKHLN